MKAIRFTWHVSWAKTLLLKWSPNFVVVSSGYNPECQAMSSGKWWQIQKVDMRICHQNCLCFLTWWFHRVVCREKQEKAHGSRLCLNVAKNENDSFFCKQMIAIFYLLAGMGLSSWRRQPLMPYKTLILSDWYLNNNTTQRSFEIM